MKKLQHNTKFDKKISKIKNITWYPYVGQDFEKSKNKTMVFAHNIPCAENEYEKEVARTKSKTFFADVLDEYTYINESWSMAFRNFVKGAIGLTANYNANSEPAIIQRIDSFVRSIAYTNFIDGLVKTNTKTNVFIPDEQKERSKTINLQILQTLNITHCICWGKDVFNYVCQYSKTPIKEQKLAKGFSTTKITLENGQKIKVLKIFHPSMPSFKHLHASTHNIFEDFWKL